MSDHACDGTIFITFVLRAILLVASGEVERDNFWLTKNLPIKNRYDLVLASEHGDHLMVKSLLALLHNPEYFASEQAQPGYCIGSNG